MMIFNPDQANFLIKNGATVSGAGKHKKTLNFYVFFNKDLALKNAMDAWTELCKQSR